MRAPHIGISAHRRRNHAEETPTADKSRGYLRFEGLIRMRQNIYLRFEGLIRMRQNIYLRFEGVVLKYKRSQNRMIPATYSFEYPAYRVLATP